MDKALNELSQLVSKVTYRKSNSLRKLPGYTPVLFDKKNFHEIDRGMTKHKLVFIDGGNTSLFNSASLTIHFIRISSLIYEKNRRTNADIYEFFLLVHAEQEKELIFKTQAFFLNNKEINKIKTLIFKEKDFPDGIKTIPGAVRKLAELKIAENSIKNLNKNDIIVLDGTLKSHNSQDSEFLNNLLTKARSNNLITIAIAKTTNLLTDTGDAALPAISKLSPHEIWYYNPLFSQTPDTHPVNMYIAKLHPQAAYIFRIEIDNKASYDKDEIFTALAVNSTDPVFFGYPYGLVEADRDARVSNTEKEYLKTLFKSKVKLSEYETTQDAHEILDAIS